MEVRARNAQSVAVGPAPQRLDPRAIELIRQGMEDNLSYRTSMGLLALSTMLALTAGVARAADEAKYPTWKGQWNAIVTPGLVGAQFKFDPTKDRGLGQQAPLTDEYRKVHADSMAEQANGGLGNYPTARCLPGGMPRMMASQTQEYVITPETTYILLSSSEDPFAASSPTDASGPRSSSRPIRVIRSANGPSSMPMAATPCSRSRRAASRVRAPMMRPDCRCTSTTSRCSRSGSISTRTIRSILHDEITVFDHALTRPWSVDKTFRAQSEPASELARERLQRGQQPDRDRQRELSLARGRLADAGQEGQTPPDLRYFEQPAR